MRNAGLVLFLSASSLLAQATGRISGSVADASGAAVPGAAVKLFIPGGSQPVLASETTVDGLFNIVGVRAATYDLVVEATGFVKSSIRGVKVDPARQTDIPAIKLELPSVTTSIEVEANAAGVQTASVEVATTITTEQVRRLPLIDRDPVAIVYAQAGVSYNPRADTVINGQRASFTNVSIDGINIQDNFIRDNAVDYTPNMLLLGQVSEFTVSTSNSNSAMAGGASQISFVTPSGTNQFHGAGYWYNRNNFFSSNDWFDNASGVPRAFLNQNQLGGSIGGPIKKDKLFFYTNYEAYRQRQQSSANRIVPTADARAGIFTYTTTAGAVQRVNILNVRQLSVDPAMQAVLSRVPGPESINNFDVGDSRPGQLRNTAGYRFRIRDNRNRDNYTAKIDYHLSTRHVFTGTYLWNRDNSDRSDLATDFSSVPKVSSLNHANLLSTAWRWTPTTRMTNELRFGFNLAPGDFPTSEQFPAYLLDGLAFGNPVNGQMRQGRNTRTWNFADNAAYQRGKHNLQFGFQMQRATNHTWDYAGTLPTYTLGMSASNTATLTTQQLPGARGADVTRANSLLASLAGFVTSATRTFNVTSRSSGYVPGAPNERNYFLSEYALYAQDQWKISPRLTATLGLRYVLYGVPDERDGLTLSPVVRNGDPIATLLSNSTLDFAGAAAGRPWYARDKRNFGPNAGLAWDVFGNGKTAVRAGYSINYVNDQTLLSTLSLLEFNAGLIGSAALANQNFRVSNLRAIPAPAYKIPRTFADNYADDPYAAFGLLNPGLRTPYVQQYSIGIQQQFRGMVLEARYVGNHTTRAIRAFDVNQVVIRENGFLDDFIRARNNGFAAVRAGRAFDPRYNANTPGSVPLTVFSRMPDGGSLTYGEYRNLIRTGEVGELAALYSIYGENGNVQFFRNPNALAADYLTNYSNATYNSLQVEMRRPMAKGLDFQANYTYSKVLSDAPGTSQSRIEHFLDSANPKIERARADFDLTHMIKATGIYELPLGKGRRWNYKPLEKVLEGWSMSGIMAWQSGGPFSILSARGTLNRLGGYRSDQNTAVSLLDKSGIEKLFGVRLAPDGPYFIARSAINPQDGSGVGADGDAPFSGQAFFHPGPGSVGALQRRMFSGPWTFNLDFGVQKMTKFGEKKSVEFRMEGSNILNHASFVMDDQYLDGTSFGQMTWQLYGRRLIQFGLYFRF